MRNSRHGFKDNLKAFRIVLPYFSEGRRALAIGLASLLAVDILQLAIPLVIKRAVDDLAGGKASLNTLLIQAGGIIAIALVIGCLRYVWRLGIFGISRRIEMGLRNQLFSHLLTMPPSFFTRNPTGDLMARSVNDVNAVRMASGMGLVALVDAVVLGLASVAFMLAMNVELTLICLLPAPFIVFLGRRLTRRMSSGFERVQRTFSSLTEKAREGFAAIRVIKANARQTWQLSRFRREGELYVAENMSLAKTMALFFPVMAVFTSLGLAAVIWMGGNLAVRGIISPGDLVAFTSYLNLMTWPIMAMGWVANLIQRGGASLKRIEAVLTERSPMEDTEGITLAGAMKGEIEAKNLWIGYEGNGDFILRGVSLRIPAGQTADLVGRVG